ncbi:MAG: MFS transporter [Chloroflexota bacterium]
MKVRNLSPSSLITKARTRVFYGWYIVAAFVVENIFVVGVVSKGLTTLVSPIAASFGWSYAQISLAMSLRSMEHGVLGPFFGRAVDRYPAKWLILIGIIIEVIGYIILSQTRNLAMFYTSFVVAAAGGSLASHMAPTATIARWFKKNIGKVNGIVAMGIGLGGYVVPVLVFLIDAYGWRTAIVLVAALVGVVGIPLAFVYRDKPEDYGLLPDGAKPESMAGTGDLPKIRTIDFNPSVKEAMKMRAFWQMGFAEMFHWACVGALTLHIVPYLSSPTVGLSRAEAAMVTMVFLLLGVPARFMWGWLADIFQKRYLTAISIAMMAVGLFFFAGIKDSSFWMAVAFIVVFGIGFGGANPLRATIVREYFGARHFGSIFGLQQIFVTVSSVITPPLAGWVYDARGTYDPIWLVLAFTTAVGAVLMFTMPRSEADISKVATA